ncbi:Histidine-binding periplasmic protein precursor [Shimia sp. SK013]|uniref:substrate-binding periplasmic protein n=1 Tax=Shimia sp. SK013 TaxID=1389006 RepID=UPI0006B5E310|nr:transporter substrate-binding domain-containing protein [Shimia sp. SK013]KPA22295.1 Histidine-binding periplasmic protein precursor [Shimia sp. SK013]
MSLNTRVLLKPLAVALSLAVAPFAQAADVNLITAQMPPFANGPDAEDKGMAIDLVAEMVKRADLEMTVTYEPWPRAVKSIETTTNNFLAPPFRTPEREDKFSWVAKLLSANQIFVTQGAAINSFEDARGLEKISVLRGSAMEKVLTEQGFTNLHPVTSDVQGEKLLVAGRVDAMYSVDIVTNDETTAGGFLRSDFTMGAPVVVSENWLAANLDLDPAVKTAMSVAMDSMRTDGTYEAIVTKYLN